MFTVEKLQSHIQEQIGLTLEPCDYFTGAQTHNGETYFNFLVNDRYAESQDVLRLERLAKISSIISRIEPNGLNRVAVFIR